MTANQRAIEALKSEHRYRLGLFERNLWLVDHPDHKNGPCSTCALINALEAEEVKQVGMAAGVVPKELVEALADFLGTAGDVPADPAMRDIPKDGRPDRTIIFQRNDRFILLGQLRKLAQLHALLNAQTKPIEVDLSKLARWSFSEAIPGVVYPYPNGSACWFSHLKPLLESANVMVKS